MQQKKVSVILEGVRLDPSLFNLQAEDIGTIIKYQLNKNLWGTLIDKYGNPELADSYSISNDFLTYSFHINGKSKFSDGKPILPDDVKFSIMRALNGKDTYAHAQFSSIIESVSLNLETVQIKLKKPTPTLIYLLSTSEMSIVRQDMYDEKNMLKSRAITSGPYFVVAEPNPVGDMVFELKRNKFFLTNNQSPDSVKVIVNRNTFENLKEQLTKYEPDFVEAYTSYTLDLLNEENDIINKYQYYSTVPTLSVFLVPNKKLLTNSQICFFKKIFRDNFEPPTIFKQKNFLKTNQILPPGTFGELQASKIDNSCKAAQKTKFNHAIRIATSYKSNKDRQSVERVFATEGIKMEWVDLDYQGDVHFIFRGQGMNLSNPEIEFYLNGVSDARDFEPSIQLKNLIEMAFHEPYKPKRHELIQKISMGYLKENLYIPLFVRPYIHFYNKNVINLDDMKNFDGDVVFAKFKISS